MDGHITRLDEGPLLWERVYSVLEDLIIRREIPSGTHLAESDLAERLGVSRSPVREALRALQQKGWVEFRPRQGAFVREPTADEALHLFEARSLLEPDVAGRAAERAGPGDVAELRGLLASGAEAARVGDAEALVRLNSAFHARVRRLAGNRILEEVLDRLDELVRWYFASIATVRGHDSWVEHARLVDAIEAGDREDARAIMARHVEASHRAHVEAHQPAAPGAGELPPPTVHAGSQARPASGPGGDGIESIEPWRS